MSGSGRQFDRPDTVNINQMTQLRRLICLLVVWTLLLTLGLAVSILLHFILPRDPSNEKSVFLPPTSPPTVPEKSTLLFSLMMDFDNEFVNGTEFTELKWTDRVDRNRTVDVPEDAKYFFYLQVTLEFRDPAVNYTVLVEMFDTKDNAYIGLLLTGHINGSQLSTGFMGKAFRLNASRRLKVIYKPHATLNRDNTYVGIMKIS